MTALADRVRGALDAGRLSLPPLGGGRTADRWAALLELGADDVGLARLAEAHVDAIQILAEAGNAPPAGRLLGVWAAEHPTATVTAAREPASGRLVLRGSKSFCSGAGIVDAALVTVVAPEGRLLVQVPTGALEPGRIDGSGWKVRALADVRTATVDLDGIVVPVEDVIGGPGWYLDRPGFWDGAIGPAACWAGAAVGLVRLAADQVGDDPHALAHLGGLAAAERALRSVLEVAGHEQDGQTRHPAAAARRALEVRHAVDLWCADIEQRFARGLGPRMLAFDAEAADRLQALAIYRRQCHGERDLAVLGALVSAAAGTSADP